MICYGAVAVLMNYSLPEDDIISLMEQMDSSVFLYGKFGALEKGLHEYRLDFLYDKEFS